MGYGGDTARSTPLNGRTRLNDASLPHNRRSLQRCRLLPPFWLSPACARVLRHQGRRGVEAAGFRPRPRTRSQPRPFLLISPRWVAIVFFRSSIRYLQGTISSYSLLLTDGNRSSGQESLPGFCPRLIPLACHKYQGSISKWPYPGLSALISITIEKSGCEWDPAGTEQAQTPSPLHVAEPQHLSPIAQRSCQQMRNR